MDQTEQTTRPENDEVCPLCKGVEWIFTVREGVSEAERCQCFKKRLSTRVVPQANIPSKYARCSFDNFSNSEANEAASKSLADAMLLARTFAKEFFLQQSDPRGLLIYGRNGIGKTHLAVAAFRRILSNVANRYQAKFINYQALLELIRSGYDKPFGESRTEAYKAIEQVDLLLIDDLGANRVTDWVEDTITQLIAFRHDHQLATMVTTNYSPYAGSGKGIDYLGDRIGERATSRLREMCKVLSMPNVTDKRGTDPHALFNSRYLPM